ncbi:MAG TPA: hypothetical protein VK324_16585, partial [Tepidisphaeraceae bacterium]|nr:hypothetical protein [Tepidisphaeraceae bacterium]
MRLTARLTAVAVLGSAAGATAADTYTFRNLYETTDPMTAPGLPALNEAGTVVFRGGTGLFAAAPAAATASPVALGTVTLAPAADPRVNAGGTIAFPGSRPADAPADAPRAGVYTIAATGGAVRRVYEAPAFGDFPFDDPTFLRPPRPFVDIDTAGRVAFSTIEDGQGTVFLTDASAGDFPPRTVLRQGSGTFYNTNKAIDLTDAGRLAVQFEYTDPGRGLARGVFLLDAASPNPALTETTTALEKMSISTQPTPALDAAENAVLSLSVNDVLKGFAGGDVPLARGLYVTPGGAFDSDIGARLTKLVGDEGAFATFADSAGVSDGGTILFRATLDDGTDGLFLADVAGGPVGTDPLVGVGDPLFGSTITGFGSFLGQPLGVSPDALNDAGTVTFRATLADGRTVVVRADA